MAALWWLFHPITNEPMMWGDLLIVCIKAILGLAWWQDGPGFDLQVGSPFCMEFACSSCLVFKWVSTRSSSLNQFNTFEIKWNLNFQKTFASNNTFQHQLIQLFDCITIYCVYLLNCWCNICNYNVNLSSGHFRGSMNLVACLYTVK